MTPDEKSNIVELFNQVSKAFVGYGGQNIEEQILISLIVRAIQLMISVINTGEPCSENEVEADNFSRKNGRSREKIFDIYMKNWLPETGGRHAQQNPYDKVLILSLSVPKFKPTTRMNCFDALKNLLIGIFNESVRINSWNGQSNYEIPSDLSRLTEEIIKKELSLFLLSSWVGQNGLSKLCRQAWFLVDKNIKNLNAVESSNRIGADGAIALMVIPSVLSVEEPDMPSLESVLVPEAKHEVVAMALAIIGNFASYLKKKRGQLMPSSLDYSKLALGEVMTNAMQALADHVIKGHELPRCFVVESQQSLEDEKTGKEQGGDQYSKEIQLIWEGVLEVRQALYGWVEKYQDYSKKYHIHRYDLVDLDEKVQALLGKLNNAEDEVTVVTLEELRLLFNMLSPVNIRTKADLDLCLERLQSEPRPFLELFKIIEMVKKHAEQGIEKLYSTKWLNIYRAELMIPERSDLTTVEGLMEVMRSLIAQSYRENQRLEREAGLFHVSGKTLGNSVFLVENCSEFSRTLCQSRFAILCQRAWRITNYGLPGKEPANSEFSEVVNMMLAKLCEYRRSKEAGSFFEMNPRLDKYKIKLVGLAESAIEAVENMFKNAGNSLGTVYQWQEPGDSLQVKIVLEEASSLRTVQDCLRVLENIFEQLKGQNDKIEEHFGVSHISGKKINGEPLIGATGFFGKTFWQSKLESICRDCYRCLVAYAISLGAEEGAVLGLSV